MSSVEPSALARTRRVVLVSLVVQVPQTAALAITAVVTGSSALVAQTFAAISDLAVQVFLLIGVESSGRAADPTHPFGYGRERYFWSLYAALAIFVSGFTVAVLETVRSVLHPEAVTSFALAYAVLGAGIVLDGVSFRAALRETRVRARAKGRSVGAYLRRTTEPATGTELLGNAIGLGGGIIATVALVLAQATGSPWPDTVATALIGVALMVAAAALTQQNRALLTGRGIDPQWLEHMRAVVRSQTGVVDVPELLAVVIGPSALAVSGFVTFKDELSVPEVEASIGRAASELRTRWPEVQYVYLEPVG
jgi:cation diffusion facilitator family transporter